MLTLNLPIRCCEVLNLNIFIKVPFSIKGQQFLLQILINCLGAGIDILK